MAWGNLRWIVSITHLAICLTASIGYVVRPLQSLGILWTFLNIVDIPISAVTLMLVWRHEAFAATWAIVAGTLWWYFLGWGISSAIAKRTRVSG